MQEKNYSIDLEMYLEFDPDALVLQILQSQYLLIGIVV